MIVVLPTAAPFPSRRSRWSASEDGDFAPAFDEGLKQQMTEAQGMTMTNQSFLKTIVLLVSDPVVRSVLKETLDREGYTVLATGDLGQAVDLLKKSSPDLLITRTYVEDLPGHDAAIYLREKCLSMRVLILGGLLDDDRLQNREGLLGFEIFPKPYSAADLLQKVRDVLSKPRG